MRAHPEQFANVYGLASLLDRVLLVVMYTTALRLGETMHLRWKDLDLQTGTLHVTPKEADGYVQLWEPKDHEHREVPLPSQAIDQVRQWQALAPADCPYIFMDASRWNYYREQMDAGRWKLTTDLFNNTLRKFQSRCRRAGVGHYTLHDLRRSCITNWARKGLPIHVVQHLAGHADIRTTQRYYLSVQEDDLAAAREAQRQVTQNLEHVPPPKSSPGSTDPKLPTGVNPAGICAERSSQTQRNSHRKRELREPSREGSNL